MTKSTTNIIFATPLLRVNLNNKKLVKTLISYVKKLSKKDKQGRTISNLGGWQSQILPIKDKPLVDFERFIRNHLKDFSECYEYFNEIPRIDALWFNINKTKDANNTHNHAGVNSPDFSAVFYLQVDGGRIHFINPDPYHNCMPTLKKKAPKHWNAFNSAEYFIEPKPGDLIIFPSTINHWVEPNPSKNDRISLAFNWSVE